MRIESKVHLRSALFSATLLLAIVSGSLVFGQTPQAPSTAPVDTIPYSRQKIDDLVNVSGVAKSTNEHVGASTVAGIKTYLWKESDTHRVYFFERNKQLFGEYREETFAKNSHIEQRTEYYLLNWQTRGKPQDDAATDLPFTRKTERFTWDKDVCTGSVVEWQHTWRARADGALLKSTPPVTVKMSRSPVTVKVPAELMPDKDATYSIAFRRKPADFERDFLHLDKDGLIGMTAVLNGDILNRSSMEVKEGKATATLEWPADAPDFQLDLIESVRNPPMYQMMYTSTTKGTMNLKALPADGTPIIFTP
jgi:hypothetical protein